MVLVIRFRWLHSWKLHPLAIFVLLSDLANHLFSPCNLSSFHMCDTYNDCRRTFWGSRNMPGRLKYARLSNYHCASRVKNDPAVSLLLIPLSLPVFGQKRPSAHSSISPSRKPLTAHSAVVRSARKTLSTPAYRSMSMFPLQGKSTYFTTPKRPSRLILR